MPILEQSLNFGSIHDAIYCGVVTVQDLLQYLVDKEPTPRHLAGYRAACIFLNPNHHYVNGKHFVTLNNHHEYHAIFVYSGGYPSTSQQRDQNTSLEAILKPTIQRLSQDVGFSIRNQTICSCSSGYFQTMDCYRDIVLNRPWTLMHISTNLAPQLLLEADYLTPLMIRSVETFEHDLVTRIGYLQQVAPDYWNKVAITSYRYFIKYSLLSPHVKVSKETLKFLSNLVPNLIEQWWLDLPDNIFPILQQPPMCQAYLLGFPVHQCVVNSDQIKDALILLGANQEEYLDKIRLYNQQMIDSFIQFPSGDSCVLVNTHDSLGEQVTNYPCFDLIIYQQGNKLTCFTRPEFNHLLDKEINPYNREQLPDTVLAQIACRNALAENFPDPTTLKDFLSSE